MGSLFAVSFVYTRVAGVLSSNLALSIGIVDLARWNFSLQKSCHSARSACGKDTSAKAGGSIRQPLRNLHGFGFEEGVRGGRERRGVCGGRERCGVRGVRAGVRGCEFCHTALCEFGNATQRRFWDYSSTKKNICKKIFVECSCVCFSVLAEVGRSLMALGVLLLVSAREGLVVTVS